MKKKVLKGSGMVRMLAFALIFHMFAALFLPGEVNAAVQDVDWLDRYVLGNVDLNGDGINGEGTRFWSMYAPYATMRRRQLAYYLWEAAGCPKPQTTEKLDLRDVSEEDYFYEAVQWNVENNILGLLTVDRFDPDSTLSRGQVITVLWRLAGKPSPTIADVPYTDVGDSPGDEYYTEAVYWAYENGIAEDTEDNLFRPDESAIHLAVREFFERAADAGICEPVTFYDDFQLNVSEITLDELDTYQFILNIEPDNAKDDHLVWVSSDPSVVSVNEDGYITAKGEGEADVYAISFAGNECYDYCTVTVQNAVEERGFDLKTDGYSIPNTLEGFGYEALESESGAAGYTIPYERYREVFGIVYTRDIYEQMNRLWDGNCFGMGITSGMFYKGRLPLAKYVADDASLNAGGYDELDDSDSTQAYRKLSSDSELTKLIERYQVWQISYDWNTLYKNAQRRYSTSWESFQNVLQRMNQKKETFLIVAEWKSDDGTKMGHALVTDSSRPAEDLGDGWTRVYVYDPNHPYADSFGTAEALPVYRDAENRYVDLNQTTGQWKLSVGAGGTETIDLGYDASGMLLMESKITFLGISDFPTAINSGNANFMPSDADIVNILYSSDDFSVYDSQQNLVYEKTAGKVEYINEEIVTDAANYGNNTGTAGTSTGKLILPEDEYSVNIKRGYAAYVNSENYAGITAQEAVTVTNDSNGEMSVVPETSAGVQVVVMETGDSDTFTSVSMNLDVEQSGCDISLKDNKLSLRTETQQDVDVNITTDEKQIEMEDVSADKLKDMELENYINTSINHKALFLENGSAYQLAVTSGTDQISRNITWTSSDDGIVSVSEDGIVRALKEGTVVITAVYDHIKMECKVTVVPKSLFTDINRRAYYYQPILWAVENSVTSGLKPDLFGPEESCTRGQVVTFLWRAFGEPEPTATVHSFVDVDSGEYYYKPILWAVENGITTGLNSTHFAPDATVTRGQFVTFLYRALDKPSYSIENPFEDVSSSEYYSEPILWALENKVTTGLDEKHFGPEEICTRGQVVTFLYRALYE